jgi:hypothetical protein
LRLEAVVRLSDFAFTDPHGVTAPTPAPPGADRWPHHAGGDSPAQTPLTDGDDAALARQVLEGERGGQHAALELLLRRRPQSWRDAVALLDGLGATSPAAIDALIAAWRTYRRLERRDAQSGGG